MVPQEITQSPKRSGNVVALANRKKSIKRAITYHLAGLGEKTGLVYKALEKANEWLESGTDDQVAKAMDIVIKLLPYVIEKEGLVTGGTMGPNGTVLNVQINNFDSFIKDRLANTNLGKLLSSIDIRQSPQVNSHIEEASFQVVTPPPGPGVTP